MNHWRNLLVSFILTLIYFGISLFYFFGAFYGSVTNNSIIGVLNDNFTFPALMIYAAAYGGSENTMYLVAIVEFLAIWLIAWIIVSLIAKVRKQFQLR